jgi:uncharacterized protein (TIGR00661 family)
MTTDQDIISHISSKHILYCILDWGLGHATRSAVLIDRLLLNNTLTIASSGRALYWLKKRFPNHPFLTLYDLDIQYTSTSRSMDMIRQAPKLLASIRSDHASIARFIDNSHVDIIISDHRWGCYDQRSRSIFLAHQNSIPHPIGLIKSCLNAIHRKMYSGFDEIWIPDYPTREISGELSDSRSKGNNHSYIGPLTSIKCQVGLPKVYDIGIILSGPEPMRSQLEQKLINLLASRDLKISLIRGSVDNLPSVPAHWEVVNMASAQEVEYVLNHSQLIISRSGYSSIMDIWASQQTHILIPTPGLPEQEYLAALHSDKWQVINQAHLTKELIPKISQFIPRMISIS